MRPSASRSPTDGNALPRTERAAAADASHAGDDEPSPLRFRHRLEYAGFRVVHGLLAALPLAITMPVIAWIAGVVVRVVPRLRRIGLINLGIAFPEKSERERLAILVASWRNLGRMIAELGKIDRLTAANVRDVVGFDDEPFYRESIVDPHHVLAFTGHFGNWELFHIAQGFLGTPVHLVHQTIKNPLIDAFVERLRTRSGTHLMRKHAAARGVLRVLGRDGGIMVLPLDQNASRRTGVFVDFFGRPASTNSGFARIALRTGAPIHPAFILREGTSRRHRIVILPRVTFGSMANPDHAAVEVTQRCTAVLEDMIRKHPDHWLWTHKRWRTRPLGEPELYKV